MAEISNEVMDNVVDEINEVAANDGYGVGATLAIVAAGTVLGNIAMKGICWTLGKAKKLLKKEEIVEVVYEDEDDVE